MTDKVTIGELGGRGDGITTLDGKSIFIPFSAPGDKVDIKVDGNKGRLRHIHHSSSHRVDAKCKHFTKCGGCAVQHINEKYYRLWKSGLVRTALENQGFKNIDIRPLEMSSLHSRRRTTFHVIGRNDGNIVLGYAEKGSHNLIDLDECPILVSEIVNFISPLKVFLKTLLNNKQKMSIQITRGDNGLDVAFKGKGDVDLNLRMDLATFAQENDLARVSWFDTSLKKPYYEMLAELKKPYVTFEGNKVFFPQGAFIQATEQGQQTLINIMLESLQDGSHVVDLFSGCGTFSIAAAQTANVHAVENNKEMLSALKSSSNIMTGIKQITTELRDLFMRPLLPHELDKFDVAIIDPPRAGAKHQIQEIINSKIKTLVMVSCNPLSFARDVQDLSLAGFKMGSVNPVDQFLFSPHLEIITIFKRT